MFSNKALALGVAAVAACAIPAAASTSAQTSSQQARYCIPSGGLLEDATRVVHGTRAGGGIQTTEYLPSDVYRVSLCDADGTLVRAQLVGPITVPGGQSVRLPYWTENRLDDGSYGGAFATYPDPRDPRWAAVWPGVTKARANVTPPTPEGRVTAERTRGADGTLSDPHAK
ncbi:MAG TPA: hypothetical protein VGW75_02790 [Solirubrobacteraceae bacterium]|jgi:hypothetical protein|nr:hypothetical protein [Solirubrobacteraceae bacterium]